MRILVISNLYPPHYIGGYELGCCKVVEQLKVRGHQVEVLTSNYGTKAPESDGKVHRLLSHRYGAKHHWYSIRILKLFAKERRNLRALETVCAEFEPQIVYVWNMSHISVSLAAMTRTMGIPVCYFMFDHSLCQWKLDNWYTYWNRGPIRRFIRDIFTPERWPFGLWRPTDLALKSVHCASGFLKDKLIRWCGQVDDLETIHWGLMENEFPFKENSKSHKNLLYIGQLMEHKGLHTVIEAMKTVFDQKGKGAVTLTIVGGSLRPEYETMIRDMVSSFSLDEYVRFMGHVPLERLPSIYQDHDIVVFPSIWDEPFGIVRLEAMSSGLPLVSTATGGGSEILSHNENSLIFQKDNGQSCADQIMKLLESPELFEKLREGGRRTVQDRFSFDSTMDKIENSLESIRLS